MAFGSWLHSLRWTVSKTNCRFLLFWHFRLPEHIGKSICAGLRGRKRIRLTFLTFPKNAWGRLAMNMNVHVIWSLTIAVEWISRGFQYWALQLHHFFHKHVTCGVIVFFSCQKTFGEFNIKGLRRGEKNGPDLSCCRLRKIAIDFQWEKNVRPRQGPWCPCQCCDALVLPTAGDLGHWSCPLSGGTHLHHPSDVVPQSRWATARLRLTSCS